ncbi:MAG: sulfotransferase family protein [Pseudomonadota bacterium]
MNSGHCKRICLWSGPRNVSTAVLYAFDQRQDTVAVDEPLYGHYLSTSGADHPGAEKILPLLEHDGEKVIRETVLGPCEKPVLFLKLMAHHLPGLDRAFMDHTSNVILTRNPREVLATLRFQVKHPTMADAGYDQQVALLERYPGMPVLDAKQLLLNPAAVLRELCDRLSLRFNEAMLSWPEGPKACDGPWAPYWYHNVHKSRGFAPFQPSAKIMPAELEPLLKECQPLYETLLERAIRAPDLESTK